MRFAEDIIPFAESEEKLRNLLEDLNEHGKDGVKLGKKTKIMCNGIARRQRRGVQIDREQLEEVSEYKYLKRLITSKNEMSKENDHRITSE